MELEVFFWSAAGVISVAKHILGPQMQLQDEYILGEKVDAAAEIHIRYSPLFKDLFSRRWPWGPRWEGSRVKGILHRSLGFMIQI